MLMPTLTWALAAGIEINAADAQSATVPRSAFHPRMLYDLILIELLRGHVLLWRPLL
jgi:hypothetical protein